MLAHGTTFTFKNNQYSVTSIQAQSARAEVVNMTHKNAAAGFTYLYPTGDYAEPASVDIEFLGSGIPLAKDHAMLAISGAAGAFSSYAICESATREARVGDVVRGRARFVITDAAPS